VLTLINSYRSLYPSAHLEYKQKPVDHHRLTGFFIFYGRPTAPLTELFTVWDHFPIHHFRRNKKPVIAIGHKPPEKLITQKLHHPNYLKRALYYHELLENDHIESQTALAKQVGISRTKTRLILRLLKLDEKIKDSILNLDDSDPRLGFLSVYRLQPLLQVKSKERQRRKFWKMIEGQYPDQSAAGT